MVTNCSNKSFWHDTKKFVAKYWTKETNFVQNFIRKI